MVAVYDTRSQELLEYVKRLDLSWREYEALETAIATLREALVCGSTPFVELVVKTPPPLQKAPMDGLGRSYNEHGVEFCDWVNNLHQIEVHEEAEGTVAYRFTKVMPFCRVERVTRYKSCGSGWLSRKEERQARKTDT